MWFGGEKEKTNPRRWSEIWKAMKVESVWRYPGDGDRTIVLSDEVLLKILGLVSDSRGQRNWNSLVCKRWLKLQGRLVRSLRVRDWNFVLSGRLMERFPNLNHIDLLSAAFLSPPHSAILLSNAHLSIHLHSNYFSFSPHHDDNMLPVQVIDNGLASLAASFPNLRRLQLSGATDLGLASVALECSALQDLELHQCCDNLLRGIRGGFQNLHFLKLVGFGFFLYSGLTVVAQSCSRLVKLELCGCEGSFDGIKAIANCCLMLEELTFSHHSIDHASLPAISFFHNLHTLRFHSCKRIHPNPNPNPNPNPIPDDRLGYCPSLQRLHFHNCHFRLDRKTVPALFSVSRAVTQILLHHCWGFDNATFAFATICRRVKLLSLQGCSLLTTQGLESVIHGWKELESLRVVSCKNIKDNHISPALATLFTTLKDFTWSPDTKSLPSMPMGKRGAKFFKSPPLTL